MDSRWDSERFLFLRLPVDFSIFACNPCKLDHSDRPAIPANLTTRTGLLLSGRNQLPLLRSCKLSMAKKVSKIAAH
jgi:hypothetical protein